MTAVRAPATSRPRPATRRPVLAAARLLRLELRHNAMPWMLPVAAALFWFTTYRKAMAMPPLWNLRAASLQSGALVAFVLPVVGAAAWMGSREGRRRTADLVTITARPRSARLLATWAATTCWAMAGYLGCLAVLYGVTAQQATWGGPLWWPAAVGATSLPALSALGFAAGTLVPSRFTAPLAAVAAFFALALSTQLIHGSQSYWQISPLVTGPWDTGPDAGVATFYPYLPDLSIAQVMFLAGLTVAVLGALVLPKGSGGRWLRQPAAVITTAGLLAAGTAIALAGTGTLDAHGMIAIPALHDAANDRPVRYTPVCSHTAIPVCLNPAYASYLPATSAALDTGAQRDSRPARRADPHQPGRRDLPAGHGQLRQLSAWLAHPSAARRRCSACSFPTSCRDPRMTTSAVGRRGAIKRRARHRGQRHRRRTRRIPGAASGRGGAEDVSRPAAVSPASAPGSAPAERLTVPLPVPVQSAARRFAALPASARHAWLVQHLAALRAGRITLAQLP